KRQTTATSKPRVDDPVSDRSARRAEAQPATPPVSPEPTRPRRLSYKEQRELDGLPSRIEALQEEQRALNATTAGPDFYKEPAEAINRTLARVDTVQQELNEAYARWDELESRAIKN